MICSAAAQAALLRVLEEHEVRAVGAPRPLSPVDVRVVAATHRDLDALVEDDRIPRRPASRGSPGFELELPALADRRVDLGLMLSEILPPTAQLAAASGRARCSGTIAGRATSASSCARSNAPSRWQVAASCSPSTCRKRFRPRATKRRPVRERDARHDELVALLQKHRGNVSQVAAELGKVRQQVQRWLKRYGLDPDALQVKPTHHTAIAACTRRCTRVQRTPYAACTVGDLRAALPLLNGARYDNEDGSRNPSIALRSLFGIAGLLPGRLVHARLGLRG